ncbi:DNA alkylation repair protein [Planococcus ruber]|uniref:DNA alkylation repair protein n=1 Tax=Planococcus ruber TaxID=2027871 RepID=UPI001FEDB3DD|nr:DNA alkylation repair protein [Planococcus ruber]MCJ1909167.1 DNA alkylation repair protein [Planococcus ruber]
MKKTWDHQALVEKFEANRNGELALPMAAYMRNQFPFLGIKTPLRNALLKQQFEEYHLPSTDQLIEEVWKLYRLPEREYHYAAIALLEKRKGQLTLKDLPALRQFIESDSWWDSVDSIAPKIVGHVVATDRLQGSAIMLEWSEADNMWTNRAAILHQLKYKRETDRELLAMIVQQHAASTEFFIQKSIGWALREYAKTNPEWVGSFTGRHSLMPLSRREALRNIH